MTGKTHRIRRMVKALALASCVTAFAVPAAQAASPQVDDWFRDGLNVTATQTSKGIVDDSWRSAPTVSAPTSNPIVDDYFRDGLRVVSTPGVANRIVDDSFRDAPAASGVANRIVDDSFRDAPAAAASSNGLDWGDLGIGLALGAAGLLLLAGLAAARRETRHGRERLGSA
jgi:hypothetical protein